MQVKEDFYFVFSIDIQREIEHQECLWAAGSGLFLEGSDPGQSGAGLEPLSQALSLSTPGPRDSGCLTEPQEWGHHRALCDNKSNKQKQKLSHIRALESLAKSWKNLINSKESEPLSGKGH